MGRQTDRPTPDQRGSEKLSWAFSSDELQCKNLFTKSCHISSNLMRIWLTFCRIKIFYFCTSNSYHILDNISQTGYYYNEWSLPMQSAVKNCEVGATMTTIFELLLPLTYWKFCRKGSTIPCELQIATNVMFFWEQVKTYFKNVIHLRDK